MSYFKSPETHSLAVSLFLLIVVGLIAVSPFSNANQKGTQRMSMLKDMTEEQARQILIKAGAPDDVDLEKLDGKQRKILRDAQKAEKDRARAEEKARKEAERAAAWEKRKAEKEERIAAEKAEMEAAREASAKISAKRSRDFEAEQAEIDRMNEEALTNPMGVPESYTPMDWNDRRPPRILFGSVLKHLKVKLDGEYWFEDFTTVFLPEKDVDGQEIPWTSVKQERLHVQLLRNGELISDFYHRPHPDGPVSHLAGVVRDAYHGVNNEFYRGDAIMQAGAHELRFMLDDQSIWRFPFEVKAIDQNDPYADPPVVYQLNGPWNNMIGVSGATQLDQVGTLSDDQAPIFFYTFFRNEDSGGHRSTQMFTADLIRHGERVGSAVADMTGDREWTERQVKFYDVDSDGTLRGTPFTYSDLKDGDYVIDVYEVDAKRNPLQRGRGAQYKFSVADGRFVLPTRMTRETDPMDYIEGGGKTIWVTASESVNPWLIPSN